ncbi:MAG: NAD(P)/FAD-dependent oxidoreductase, partial [Clostridia bacterium]|nr:NAD(P)/FAD-dependent oxidoreductase [Clostridia bacterium]
MKNLFDIAVIGGGVIGGMIARRLSAYELKICILEKEHDVARGASAANSSIVHAGFDAKEGSMKAKMNVRGSEMMAEVCRELGVKYQNNGSLVLGFDAEDRVTLEDLLKRGNTNGVKDLRLIEQDELRAMEPNIAKEATCALHAPTGGIVCPYELTIAAIGNAMDNGAELFTDFAVSDIRDAGDHFEIFSQDEQTVNARYIINAAGLFSDAIAKMVGDDSFTITPRRGEYLLLDRECGGLVKNTIFRTPGKMGKGLLVTPTVDGNLLVGPTSVDQEDKSDKSTTIEGLSLIRAKSAENAEGVPFGKTITSFCGLRAVGSVGDFIINIPRDRFVNVAGIESPGLSSSPAIAEYVLELLKDTELVLTEKENFDPIRPATHAFREGTIEEKNAMIQKDPAYGRIICRCEGVSEGEILAAIRQNPRPKDLDGVKRRTRAQMGRCQGGFCSPYIVEMLSKEW